MANRAIALLAIFAVLIAAPLCFAQTRAGVEPTPEGQSTFGSVAVTGITTGAPGYISLIGADGASRYYIWVGTDDKLRIASDQIVSPDASPTTSTWADASGVIIGLQWEGITP